MDEYAHTYINVYCTDTDKTSEAKLIKQNESQLRLELNGIPMTFHKHRPSVFVSRMHGLEFIVRTDH